MAASPYEFSDSGVTQATAKVLADYYVSFAANLRKIVENPPGRATEVSRDYAQARAAMQLQQIDRILLQLDQERAMGRGEYPRRVQRRFSQGNEAGDRDGRRQAAYRPRCALSRTLAAT